MAKKFTFVNREISWLGFNARVLQEAADADTPLIERLKFLGIFSNNQDEFFRVRVATIRRLLLGHYTANPRLPWESNPADILDQINEIVLDQQEEFERVYADVTKALEKAGIYIINEKQLTKAERSFCQNYFEDKIRSLLFPLMLDSVDDLTNLPEQAVYLAVVLTRKKDKQATYAVMELPVKPLSRFIVLPQNGKKHQRVILLDDVIRDNLHLMFSKFGYRTYSAYTFKFTRDSEIDLEDDFALSYIEKLAKGLKLRKKGNPVRFVHDVNMPNELLDLVLKKMQFSKDDPIIPGGRYHNFKDFMRFPNLGRKDLIYKTMHKIPVADFEKDVTMFDVIKERDFAVHYPYHSFDYMIEFLREASIDPQVSTIKMTAYRLASNSKVANALINAAKNGKKVTVYLELQARFDEAANITWANRFKEEGVRVHFGMPDQKVHSKFCLIKRKEEGGSRYYLHLSTGNFNESTADIYCDDALFTANQELAKDFLRVSKYLEGKQPLGYFKHLLVAPYNLRTRVTRLIRNEMAYAKAGKKAHMIIKLNNLADPEIIRLLYRASKAGVVIDLIIRGICCLDPNNENCENINVTSIVDGYLEHSRLYYFYNGGAESMYLASSDWMVRNLDLRVETATPIFDPAIKKVFKDMLDLQLRDNRKARYVDTANKNEYKPRSGRQKVIRSQWETYDLLEGRKRSRAARKTG